MSPWAASIDIKDVAILGCGKRGVLHGGWSDKRTERGGLPVELAVFRGHFEDGPCLGRVFVWWTNCRGHDLALECTARPISLLLYVWLSDPRDDYRGLGEQYE